MATRFYSSLVDLVVRHRGAAIALYLIASVALSWAGSSITLRTEITDLLPEGVDSGDDLRFYLERFGSGDAFFLSIALAGEPGSAAGSGSDGRDAMTTAEPVGGIETLEEVAELLADRLRATGLFRSVLYGFSEEDALAMARHLMAHLPVLAPGGRTADLRRRTSPEGIRNALLRLRSRATGPFGAGPIEALASVDPLGLLPLLPAVSDSAASPVPIDPGSGLLLSPDGRAALVVAMPKRPPQDVDFSRRLVARAEAIEEEIAGRWPGVRIDHAGGHLFAVQDEGRIRHDITWTASVSMIAIALLFALTLRRLTPLVIVLVPLALSTLWTLGVASFYPGHLNVVSVAFAAILLGMGDDSLMHLYLRFRSLAAAGLAPAEALRSAAASTGPSILVATLAGGLAFASLSFVKFRGLSELGIIAAIGMLSLLVSVFVLLPALLSFRVSGGDATATGGGLRLPMGPFVRFHRWASARRLAVLTVFTALVLLAGLACARLEFSSDIRALRGADPARDRLERVLAPFGGLSDPVHVMREASPRTAGGPEPSAGAVPEESLRWAESALPACRRLQAEGLLKGFESPTAWMPPEATQRARFEANSSLDWEAVARHLREAASGLDLDESFFAPFLTDLHRYATWEEVRIEPREAALAGGPLAMSEGLAGTAAVITLHPAANRSPREIAKRAREIDPDSFGPPTRIASVALVVDDLTRVIEEDFRRASLIALLAVALTAAVAFRAVSRVILVWIPVAAGCLMMLGGLALLGIPINLMNLVATPLVLGLGINFGVHIVNRHEEEGGADIEAVLRQTGGAILLTGLTTLTGFGSLLAADFAGLRSMGWVAVLGIAGCLISALLILPLLLPAPAAPRPPAPQ